MNKMRGLELAFCALLIWDVALSTSIKKINTNNCDVINEYEINGFSSDLTEVFDTIESSIVQVTGASSGTGFIYKKTEDKFYVLTAAHLVGKSTLKVTLGNSLKYEATLVGEDIYSDIALLEVDAKLEVMPIKFGSSSRVKNGEFLVSSGFTVPNEFERANRLLMVSNSLETLNNSITFDSKNYSYYIDVLSFNENVEKGFSGAGVFNTAGELVGMISFKDDESTYALTSDEIKIVAEGLLEKGSIFKRQFGFKGTYINQMKNYLKTGLNIGLDVTNGLYVDSVNYTGLANSMGLKNGDVITSINGISINSFNDYLTASYQDTKEYHFDVNRSGALLTLNGSVE